MLLLFGLLTTLCFEKTKGPKASFIERQTITQIEMNLSAYGVESDEFPSIRVFIDVEKDSNRCERTYYNPKFKSMNYTLADSEIETLLALLNSEEFHNLRLAYVGSRPDQPTSTIKVNRNSASTTIVDSGLIGANVLQKIYHIAYKF